MGRWCCKRTLSNLEYTDSEYQVFDVEYLLQELVKEGRPVPSHKALTKLLEIFYDIAEER